MHPMVLQGDKAQVESRFGAFVDSVNLDQDRCMASAKCTIVSEIILNKHDGTPS
jgi:hypothetical protein